MGEFMPYDLLPVNRTRRFMPSWRTQGDYAAETDPEEVANIGQTRSAHGKIFVLGEQFNQNRSLGDEIVFGGERFPALLQKRFQIGPEHTRLRGMQADDEVFSRSSFITIEYLEYLQQVHRPHVKRVSPKALFQVI